MYSMIQKDQNLSLMSRIFFLKEAKETIEDLVSMRVRRLKPRNKRRWAHLRLNLCDWKKPLSWLEIMLLWRETEPNQIMMYYSPLNSTSSSRSLRRYLNYLKNCVQQTSRLLPLHKTRTRNMCLKVMWCRVWCLGMGKNWNGPKEITRPRSSMRNTSRIGRRVMLSDWIKLNN